MNIPAIRRVLDVLEGGGAIWLSYNDYWYRLRGGVIERSECSAEWGSIDKVEVWVKAGFDIGDILGRIRDADKTWLPEQPPQLERSNVRRVEL